MNLDELRRSVTAAILYTESLTLGTPEARAAFAEVSELEEAIAALVSAKDVEGEVARLGAVSAALAAGKALRALRLAEQYLRDDLSDGVRMKLLELREIADGQDVTLLDLLRDQYSRVGVTDLQSARDYMLSQLSAKELEILEKRMPAEVAAFRARQNDKGPAAKG